MMNDPQTPEYGDASRSVFGLVQLDAVPNIEAFFDPRTNTITYVVSDPNSDACAVIDPVMDFDYASGRVSYDSADAVLSYIESHGLDVQWLIETHVHADHLSSAHYLKQRCGGKTAIGKRITNVQTTFAELFGEDDQFPRDGRQFDLLLEDGDTYDIGTITGFAMHTPGHTPACMTHVIGNAAFVGDTLFMPDSGSARADFPGGDASQLYSSIKRVLSLPDEMRLFMCHDYGPDGRDFAWETTVGEEKANNIHVGGDKNRESFVKLRTERDKQLSMPSLIIPSIQINMRGGEMPKADSKGRQFLKLPLNAL